MTDSIINRIVSTPPPPGHRISFMRLTGTESAELTALYTQAGRVACKLRDLGVGPGDRIGIMATNCLEWVLLDLAALRLKAVTAGLDTGKFDPGAAVADYRLKLLFTDQASAGRDVLPMDQVRRFAEEPGPADPPPVRYARQDVTTLRFTSGSTGTPKAIAPTTDNVDFSMHSVQQMFRHGPGDDLFCFLPLVLQQQRFWIYSALCFGHDVTVSTYEAAFAALPRSQPTVVMGVPAFYDAAKTHIEAAAKAAGPGSPDASPHTAAQRLFGSRIRYLWTGSAPASLPTLRFLRSCGLPIYEGYGLNEAGIVSKNHPGAWKEGSVGRLLPGMRVTFDQEGIISVHNDHPVTSRYEYAAPGESERVFPAPGLVRSSDIGYLDEEGFLFIRGRADDAIVLGNGRKILVRPLEEYMKASSAVAECVVFCPSGAYLAAVVSPAGEPADEKAIAARLDNCNRAFGSDEQISRFVIAAAPFSIANGLLTNQFKPRRRQIFEAYRRQILAGKEGSHARGHRKLGPRQPRQAAG